MGSNRGSDGQLRRGRLFLRSIGLMAVACTLVTAVACAIGYALSESRRPIVAVSTEAADYARQALFPDDRQMAAFTARLQALAEKTKTSVAVTYVDRPQPGETLAAAMEASVEGLQKQLAGRSNDNAGSMLVIVLMGKPRMFGFAGTDRAGTRLFLRNLSGDPVVHSLNFKHIQVTHGRYLMQALAITEEALRPLPVLIEHHPAQWLVVRALERATGSVPELPGDWLLAVVKTVRAPLAKLAADYGVPPIALLLAPLLTLALGIKVIEKLADWRLKRAWAKSLVWALSRIIPIPVAGIAAVVLYGSLESIASLAQVSGQSAADLIHLARTLPTPAIPAWLTWLAIPASCVIALGITVGIGLRLTGGDAHALITPSRWFSHLWPPLRLPLQGVCLALVLVLPVPFIAALSSMEGLMSVALLVSMLIAWTEDALRFWRALGVEPHAAWECRLEMRGSGIASV
jgi:hypothetical protein